MDIRILIEGSYEVTCLTFLFLIFRRRLHLFITKPDMKRLNLKIKRFHKISWLNLSILNECFLT